MNCMNCDLEYCIYNRASACTLDKIEVNALGMCAECILVSISDGDLTKLKKEQLRAMES